MRYLSVCSGIEAASTAWGPLGWKALAFSEIEPFPRAVLKHHFPAVPLYGDFTKLRHERWIVDADLFVGGTPCQAFSVAGLRNSLSDERGNLSLEFIRLADAIDDLRRAAGRKPAWICWENVPGVLSTHDNAFGAFLGGLVGSASALLPPPGRGWRDAGVVAGPRRVAAWRVLDAQYFGLAQRRRRVFVLALGGAGGWACADALLPIIDSLSGHPAPRREAGEGAAGGASCRAVNISDGTPRVEDVHATLQGEGGGVRGSAQRSLLAYQATGAGSWREGRGPLATSDDNGTNQCIAHTLRADGFDASEDGTGRGTPLVPVLPFDTTQITSKANRSNPRAGDPCHPLAAGAHPPTIAFGWQNAAAQGDDVREEVSPTLDKSKTPAIAFSCKDHGADAGSLAPTLRAMGHGASHANAGGQVAVAIQERALSDSEHSGPGGKGWQEGVAYTMEARHRPQHVGYGMAVRRITPREAERLQGFPDDYTLVPYRGKPAADGPRYKALGNSMAVPCMHWIGERIAAVEAITDEREAAA